MEDVGAVPGYFFQMYNSPSQVAILSSVWFDLIRFDMIWIQLIDKGRFQKDREEMKEENELNIK